MNGIEFPLDINKIQQYLPHRAPFLLVDRILEIQSNGSELVGRRIIGIKSVSFNEPYMPGHFPGFAVMPGVMVIETMAQVAAFSLYPEVAKKVDQFRQNARMVLVGVDGVRFRKPVVPGDTLRIETSVEKIRGSLWIFGCKSLVEGHLVAEATIMANFGNALEALA